MADRAATLAAVREKYPAYRGVDDAALAKGLAEKYPSVYGFLALDEIPVAPKGARVAEMPSVSSFIGQRVKERAGDLAATAAGALMPGSGLLGLASRVGGAEVAKDVGDLATGQKVTPGVGGASQLVGEGIGRAVAPLLSPALYRAFANRTATALAEKMKDLVPWWKALPSDAKGLHEMAHGTGQRLISDAYDGVLSAIRPATRNVAVPMPLDDLKALGLTPVAAIGPVGHVFADDAIDAVTGQFTKDRALYRRAVNAISGELDKVAATGGLGTLGDMYRAARSQYKNASGFIDFAEKGKFLRGEQYDPARAQAALDTTGKKSLLRRDMDEVRDIVRGPGDDPITQTTRGPWSRRLYGASAAELLGLPFGVPRGAAGLIGGAAGEALLPKVTYQNVPTTPFMDFSARVGKALAGEGVREGARDLGVTEQVYGQ